MYLLLLSLLPRRIVVPLIRIVSHSSVVFFSHNETCSPSLTRILSLPAHSLSLKRDVLFYFPSDSFSPLSHSFSPSSLDVLFLSFSQL